MPQFDVLDTFLPLYTEKQKRYFDLMGGRARGGSHAAVQYCIARLMHPSYFRGYLIRRVFNDIRSSLWKGLVDQIHQMAYEGKAELKDFHFNDNNMSCMYLPNRNEILSKGATGAKGREAKFKSLEGASAVVVEEANEMTEDDMNQIDESLRTIKSTCVVIRVFNPPHRQHWMWKSDYILKPTEYDGYLFPVCVNDDIISIHSTYLDNIIHIDPNTINKFESYKTKDLDRYLRITKGLVGNGAMGRIYDGWSEISDADFAAIDAPVIYGLDFGYSPDPTAIVGIKFVKNQIYIKQYLYETGLTDAQLVKRMNDIGIAKDDFIVADYGGGGGKSIAYLRIGVEVGGEIYKYNIYKAQKKDGIKGGIQIVKGYDVFVTANSKDVWNEYSLYRLRTDADGLFTPEPVDADNHTMDAIRYVVAMKRLGLF